MAPGKLFHSLGVQTENAQSAVECCALDLVAGIVSLLISEAEQVRAKPCRALKVSKQILKIVRRDFIVSL